MYISLHLCKLKQEMGFLRFPPPPTPHSGFQSSSADLHSSTGEELFFPTFSNICEPQLLAILIDQEWLGVVSVWNAVGTWSLLFPRLLISAGVLLKGDRRRRRSPKSSGMLWPMRKPGSWQRSGRWRWRTARLPKSWRSASMRSSRWASAWVSVWGHLLQPPGWSLVGPVLGQCVLYENRNQTCLSRKEFDIPSRLIHFTLYRWGNWGSDREELCVVVIGLRTEPGSELNPLHPKPRVLKWGLKRAESVVRPAWDPAPTLLLTAVWPWEACWTSLSFLFVIFVITTLSLRFLEDSRRWKM